MPHQVFEQRREGRGPVRWYWQLLFAKVWLAAAFLLLSLVGIAVVLFRVSVEAGVPGGQRVLAFMAGTFILALWMCILNMLMPRRRPEQETPQ